MGDGLGERAYSLYDIESFIREAGAEKVTEDAVRNLEKELERLTELVAKKAKAYAAHAKRSSIRRSDVVLAKPSQSSPYAFIRKAKATNNNSKSVR